MLAGRFLEVLIFFVTLLTCTSFLLAVSENLDDNRHNHSDDVEELFNGRIEAPNKTYILDNLFKGYDKRVRPYYREKPVKVSLYAVIDSFHDIKEEQMEYKVEVILKENWKDPRLAYGNASWYVRLKGATLAKVWYPDTMIENSRKHEVDDKTRTAYLFGDGTIFLSEWVKATLSSHMDFQKYPMDVQTLRIQIAAYSYDDSQVLYKWTKLSLREHDMTEFYVEKQTLSLESTFSITGTHTAAVAEFQIRRRLQHFIMEFYLPCLACTVASWIQFWMDVTAIGDRAGLGITIVLTEIFLLQFSSQGMPKVSYMKAAELYVVVSFGFIFLALVESALVYKASSMIIKHNKKDREEKEHSDQVQSPRLMPVKEFSNGGHTTMALSPRLPRTSKNDSFNYEQGVNQSSEYILRDIPEIEVSDPPDDQSSPTASNWGLVLDRGARVLFPLTYAAFTVTYFVLLSR